MKTPKIRRKESGFTLIEVLIVVIILAILAAILVPKLLSQPENALVAEANQMLGALNRAQQTNIGLQLAAGVAEDSVVGKTVSKCGAGTGCNTTETTWQALGLFSPDKDKVKFAYECDTSTCNATRKGGVISLNYKTGNFTCDETVYTATQNNGGCRLK